MLVYYVLYGSLILASFFDVIRPKGINIKFVIYFFVLAFTLFRGLRWETGTDWNQFFIVFQTAELNNVFSYYRYSDVRTLEFGYVFLNVLVKSLTGHYTFFLIATNFYILWTYAKLSLKHLAFPLIGFIGVISLGQFFTVRQSLAVAVIIHAFNFALTRSFLKFVLFMFIAYSIHGASLIFFPVYFIIKYRISLLVFIGVAVGSVFFVEFMPVVFTSIIERFGFLGGTIFSKILIYGSEIPNSIQGEGRSLFSVFLDLCFLFLYYRMARHAQDNFYRFRLFAFLYLFLISIVISNLFAILMPEFSRLGAFFSFGSSLLLSELLYFGISRQPKLKFVFLSGFLVLMFYRFYKMTLMWPELHFPYKTIFNFM